MLVGLRSFLRLRWRPIFNSSFFPQLLASLWVLCWSVTCNCALYLSVFTQPTASCSQFQISLFFIRHQSLDRGPPPCAVALPYFDHIIYKCALQIRSHFEVPRVRMSTHLSVEHISPITVAGNSHPILATSAISQSSPCCSGQH